MTTLDHSAAFPLEEELRVAAERFAKNAFRHLEVRAAPAVCLVGVTERGQAVVIGSRWDDWSRVLDGLDADVNSRMEEAAKQEHSLALIFERITPRCDAVGRVLEHRLSESSVGPVRFASRPWNARGFDFVLTMEFERQAWERLPAANAAFDGAPSFRGFGHAVVHCMLETFRSAFLGLAAGAPARIAGASDFNELFRSAGVLMMNSAEEMAKVPPSLGGFHKIDQIASLFYERKAARGRLMLHPYDSPPNLAVQFDTPVPLHESRWARKTLETATGQLEAVSDGREILGLRDATAQDALRVALVFTGHHRWRLEVDGTVLMSCELGVPGFPRRDLERERFEDVVRRIFGDANANYDELWDLALRLQALDHGATLVIAARAVEEAARLRSSALPIAPRKLTKDVFSSVTSIDGAVLLDADGTCHAIGVILDGPSSSRESPARGSRFNSAVRYVDTAPQPASVVLVRSEDGGIDMLPWLRPMITRAALDGLVGRVAKTGRFSDDERDACRQLMHYLPYLPKRVLERMKNPSIALLELLEGDGTFALVDRYSVHRSDVVDSKASTSSRKASGKLSRKRRQRL